MLLFPTNKVHFCSKLLTLNLAILLLQDACKKQTNLRKQAATLIRDIAAVCMGLRGGVMMDYVHIKSSVMLNILADIQSQQKPAQDFKCKLHHAFQN